MDDLENLRTIAEISIALTGFTGIVAAFGKRKKGRWNNLELLRLRMLLETSLSVFFVALISLLLFSIPLPELTVWKSANIIQSALHVTGLLLLAFRASKLSSADWPKEETVFTLILLPFSLSLIGFQLAVAFGYFGEESFFILFAGLVYLLLLAVLHFILLLLPDKTDSTQL